MENLFFSENDPDLRKAFEIILSIETFSDYVKEIVRSIYDSSLDEKRLEGILRKYKIKNIENIKEELLDLLIVYINIVLNDNVITEKELRSTQYLKLLFKIQEGDFYEYCYDEIDDILGRQFIWMYRNVNKIDKVEAL